ncbi:hypothetical protein AVEN_65247-1 [Araneus ventricosus]|uniref:Uncharacterized protein n=1 Tax=Araneus ventricosus TaxID=182803 RepID=A0A4Y2AHG7_ARAVE|nr:hypothetical protein AVEN_65247-1 [Araneus ventricosus]
MTLEQVLNKTPEEVCLTSTDLVHTRLAYTVDFCWIRFSIPQPYGPEAETLLIEVENLPSDYLILYLEKIEYQVIFGSRSNDHLFLMLRPYNRVLERDYHRDQRIKLPEILPRQELFLIGIPNFEHWSDDKDDTCTSTPELHTTLEEVRLTPTDSVHTRNLFLKIWIPFVRGGLVVKSRSQGRRDPGSKPDSTEDAMCIGPAARQPRRGHMPPRWCGAEAWRGGTSPSVVLVI